MEHVLLIASYYYPKPSYSYLGIPILLFILGFISLFIAPLGIWHYTNKLCNKFNEFFSFFTGAETAKSKRLTLDSKRLDTLLKKIDVINARLENIENAIYGENGESEAGQV